MAERKTPLFDEISPKHCLNSKFRRLHKIVDGIYQRELSEFGLKGSMLDILFIIGKSSKFNQKDIARLLVIDQSTASRDIRKLEEKGWLTVRPSDVDSRTKDILITQEGLNILEKIAPIWEDVQNKMMEHLGNFNIQTIDSTLNAVQNFKE
ncbi:MarR family winged helix-turn-helix transcriptional regulator [Flagellimonas sp. S174]|uniref:MarR family winged helix-turn-helix transcriptional regulator n=1 Tax=Flagellimonas sp. S174 TaxID=3410790 RepID=UPI003BF536A0